MKVEEILRCSCVGDTAAVLTRVVKKLEGDVLDARPMLGAKDSYEILCFSSWLLVETVYKPTKRLRVAVQEDQKRIVLPVCDAHASLLYKACEENWERYRQRKLSALLKALEGDLDATDDARPWWRFRNKKG